MHFIDVESYFNSDRRYYIRVENISSFYSGYDNNTIIKTIDGATYNVKEDITASIATLIKNSKIGMVYSF